MKDLRPSSRFDMHLHSTASDGRYDPATVLHKCAAAKLDVVSLTDHDFATFIEPGVHTVDGHRVHVIPGAEISGVHEGTEYHLLVYFPHGPSETFTTFCRQQCQERAVRYELSLIHI